MDTDSVLRILNLILGILWAGLLVLPLMDKAVHQRMYQIAVAVIAILGAGFCLTDISFIGPALQILSALLLAHRLYLLRRWEQANN